ncbi:MAG: hypothetical protein WD073_09690 [Xanthobacteraceae bacterium]
MKANLKAAMTALAIGVAISLPAIAQSPTYQLTLAGASPGGLWSSLGIGVVTAIIGVYLVAVAAEGYLDAPMPAWSRLAVGAAGLCFVAPSIPLAVLGALLAAIGYFPVLGRLRTAAARKLRRGQVS